MKTFKDVMSATKFNNDGADGFRSFMARTYGAEI